MGHIRHHAIVVTATYGDWIQRAHTKAREIFGASLSEITPMAINGTSSFFVPSDGSKEGWAESHEGDARRERFKTWLREQAYEDHSSPLSWAELYYGGDDREPAIEADGKAAYRQAYAD